MQTARKIAPSPLALQAIDAVLAGARMARKCQLAGLDPKQKSADADDLVTQGDTAAQAVILDRLPKTTTTGDPIGILAEEKHESPDLQATWRWVIDPIDGTLPYSKGEPYWCVSVALQKLSANDTWESDIGSLYQASAEDTADMLCGNLFHAQWRHGAAVKNLGTGMERALTRPAHAARIAEFSAAPAFAAWALPEFTRRGITPVFRRSICHATAELLLGDKCAVIQDAGPMEWDIAAAGLIAREAGACVLLKPEDIVAGCRRYAAIFTWEEEIFDMFSEPIMERRA